MIGIGDFAMLLAIYTGLGAGLASLLGVLIFSRYSRKTFKRASEYQLALPTVLLLEKERLVDCTPEAAKIFDETDLTGMHTSIYGPLHENGMKAVFMGV